MNSLVVRKLIKIFLQAVLIDRLIALSAVLGISFANSGSLCGVIHLEMSDIKTCHAGVYSGRCKDIGSTGAIFLISVIQLLLPNRISRSIYKIK